MRQQCFVLDYCGSAWWSEKVNRIIRISHKMMVSIRCCVYCPIRNHLRSNCSQHIISDSFIFFFSRYCFSGAQVFYEFSWWMVISTVRFSWRTTWSGLSVSFWPFASVIAGSNGLTVGTINSWSLICSSTVSGPLMVFIKYQPANNVKRKTFTWQAFSTV